MAKLHYNAAQLNQLRADIGTTASAWTDALDKLDTAIDAMVSSPHISGSGADTLNAYFTHVHITCIIRPMLQLLSQLVTSYAAYYSDYLQVDSAIDAVIDTDDLDLLKGFLTTTLTSLENAAANITSAMGTIQGITKQTYLGLPDSVSAPIEASRKQLDQLVSDLNAVEANGHKRLADFFNAVTAMGSIISSYSGSSFNPSKYDPSKLLAMRDFDRLVTSMDGVYTQLEAYSQNQETIEATLQACDDEWAERAETARKAKTAIAVFEAIVFTAVIVATGPLGAVGVMAVCATVGAATAAASEGLDQWSTGSAAINEGYDGTRIAIKAGIGGVKGAIKGGLSLAGASVGAELTGVAKFGMDLGMNAVDEVVDTGFELVDGAVDGEFEETLDRVTSKEYMVEKAGSCVISTVIDTGVSAGSKKVTKKLTADYQPDLMEGAGNMLKREGITSAVSFGTGVIKSRTTDTVKAGWEGLIATDDKGGLTLDHSAALTGMAEEITDGDKWITSTITSGVSSTTSFIASTSTHLKGDFEDDYDSWTSEFDEAYKKNYNEEFNAREIPVTTAVPVHYDDAGNLITSETSYITIEDSHTVEETARVFIDTLEDQRKKYYRGSTTAVKGATGSASSLIQAPEEAEEAAKLTPAQRLNLRAIVSGMQPFQSRIPVTIVPPAASTAQQPAQARIPLPPLNP